MAKYRLFIDSFSAGLDNLTRKEQGDIAKVMSVLERVGKFSCFEASDNDVIANTMTALMKSPYLEKYIPDSYRGKKDIDARSPDISTYPWTYIRLTEAGRKFLRQTKE